MKVLQAYKPGELRVVDEEKPVPGPREVLAKVYHCGICRTDVSIVEGSLKLGLDNDPIYPVRIGHEWSGIVEQVGSECQRIKVGDRVISETGIYCGECRPCMEGAPERCIHGRSLGTIGHCWPGGFAEYILMPERETYIVPDNVSLEEAALVEPASIGFYGLSRASIGPGHNLLVVGTGPIGLGGMACAKGVGTGKIILAGRKNKKLEIGRKMGADITVNLLHEDLREVVMRETNGYGMDVILDTTGSVDMFNKLCYLLHPSGYLVIPAFYERLVPNADIDRLIVTNGTLIGSAGAPNMPGKILDLISYRHVSLKPMLTDRYPFSHVEEAFRMAGSNNETRVKVMVDFCSEN